MLTRAAGYGYNGRVAQPCDQGTYNEGGNYDACKPCQLGTTTTGPGAGKSSSDCKTAAGYAGGALCPVGEQLQPSELFSVLDQAVDLLI